MSCASQLEQTLPQKSLQKYSFLITFTKNAWKSPNRFATNFYQTFFRSNPTFDTNLKSIGAMGNPAARSKENLIMSNIFKCFSQKSNNRSTCNQNIQIHLPFSIHQINFSLIGLIHYYPLLSSFKIENPNPHTPTLFPSTILRQTNI